MARPSSEGTSSWASLRRWRPSRPSLRSPASASLPAVLRASRSAGPPCPAGRRRRAALPASSTLSSCCSPCCLPAVLRHPGRRRPLAREGQPDQASRPAPRVLGRPGRTSARKSLQQQQQQRPLAAAPAAVERLPRPAGATTPAAWPAMAPCSTLATTAASRSASRCGRWAGRPGGALRGVPEHQATCRSGSCPVARPQVGVHEVISGWDMGILGDDGIPAMKEGGKRRLVIPSGGWPCAAGAAHAAGVSWRASLPSRPAAQSWRTASAAPAAASSRPTPPSSSTWSSWASGGEEREGRGGEGRGVAGVLPGTGKDGL